VLDWEEEGTRELDSVGVSIPQTGTVGLGRFDLGSLAVVLEEDMGTDGCTDWI
jgi:hypothetical protein